jgi:hypothetical protein
MSCLVEQKGTTILPKTSHNEMSLNQVIPRDQDYRHISTKLLDKHVRTCDG